MKETLLLLAMAYPELSKKYGASVCMAGITDNNEFRRIYPIPFNIFLTFGFQKRELITYNTREKGDYRKESYKVFPETITHKGLKLEYEDVIKKLKGKITTLEELNTCNTLDKTSIGLIKPKIIDFQIKKINISDDNTTQRTLDGNIIPFDVINYRGWYIFNCGKGCTKEHKTLCLDIELGQLLRKLKTKYSDDETIFAKARGRFFDFMQTRDLHFLVGTHSYHPKAWMIISVLYPKKENLMKWF